LDAWKRALDLDDVLAALGSVVGRQRDTIEKALCLCEPIAVATDRLQGDQASAITVIQV